MPITIFIMNLALYRATALNKAISLVPGAGLEPAWMISPRDFKSLASTNFATRALRIGGG